MKIDKSKLKRQKHCLVSWRRNNYEGTIVAATGFGKTFMGILAVTEMKKTLRSNATTTVVVPSDYLRNQWREEAKKHNIDNVQVDTVHSWLNHTGIIQTDLAIFDEVHNYPGGDVFNTIFKKIKCHRRLGLTAREREKPEDMAVLNTFVPVVARVSLAECLKNNWVAPFSVYNWGLELPPREKAIYDGMNDKFIKYFSTFNFKLNLMFLALRDDEYCQQLADDMRWDKQVIKIHAVNANRIMQQRKKWLYTHDIVFDASVDAIHALKGRKIITFSEATSMADRLGEAFPDSHVYHTSLPTKVYSSNGKLVAMAVKVKNKTRYSPLNSSETYTWKQIKEQYKGSLTRVSGDKQKEEALEAFKSGETDLIHSATALNEGVDIPNIDASVKTSFNSTIIDSIQRTGRTARISNENKNKRALEINLFIKDTQSQRWLEKSQKETPNVKWVDSLDEITFNIN